MKTKNPLTLSSNTRTEVRAIEREALKTKKAVYKLNYELVMGYIPNKLTKQVHQIGPCYRKQGATLNGKSL